MTTFSFTVPGIPVPKARPRVMSTHTFTPARVRDYEKLVRYHAVEAVPDGWPLDNAAGYRVKVAVYRARRSGDLDNFCKSVTDACNGILYTDDRLISEIHALRFDDKDDPRVFVEVEAL